MITSLRLDHHDGSWADLLVQLLPSLRDFQDSLPGSAAWIQLGWLRGPHARISVATAEPLTASDAARLHAMVSETALAHPSRHDVDPAEWSRRSEALGREELVPGPYLPLATDNLVEWTSASYSDVLVGDERAAEAKGRMLARGLGIAAALVRDDTETRLASVVRGMAVVAAGYPRTGLARGYLSYLSHWKEYLNWSDPSGRIEAAWAASYRGQDRVLATILDEAVSAPELDSSGWQSWNRDAIAEATPLAREGVLLPGIPSDWQQKAARVDPALAGRWEGLGRRPYSDFHTAFRDLDTTRLGNGVDFAAYRFIENAQFELFSLAGVTPLERYGASYLFSRAVEARIGTTWQEIVADGVRFQREQEAVGATPGGSAAAGSLRTGSAERTASA